MVDELIMPKPKEWTTDMETLQTHIMANQTGKPHLWIACAGLEEGEAKHFEQSYLTSVLPPVFHLPVMEMPLRNTTQVLSMAKLEDNTEVKRTGYGSATLTKTNPVYKVPDLLLAGGRGEAIPVQKG